MTQDVSLTEQEIKALLTLVEEKQNYLARRYNMCLDDYGNVKSLWADDAEKYNKISVFYADLADRLRIKPTVSL